MTNDERTRCKLRAGLLGLCVSAVLLGLLGCKPEPREQPDAVDAWAVWFGEMRIFWEELPRPLAKPEVEG